MKREKKVKGVNLNNVHIIQGKRVKGGLRFPSQNAAHNLRFKPNELNAGIKAAFREAKSCVSRRREKVMIIDGI